MRKYLVFILVLCIAFIPSLSMAGEYAMRGEELAEINQKLDLLVLANDHVRDAVYDPVEDIVYIDWIYDDDNLTEEEDAKVLAISLKFTIPFFFEKNGIESSFEFVFCAENGLMIGSISPETNKTVLPERENLELIKAYSFVEIMNKVDSASAFFNSISETMIVNILCDKTYKELSVFEGDYSLLAEQGMEIVEFVSKNVPEWVKVRVDFADIDGVYLYSIVDGELYQ